MRRGYTLLSVLFALSAFGNWLVIAPEPHAEPESRCWVWFPSSGEDVSDPNCALWAWQPENFPNGYPDSMWGTPSEYLAKQSATAA